MRATFVGGPSHGKTEDLESTPERLWVENDVDGTRFLYCIRSEDLEAVGNHPLATSHVWYGEVDAPLEEFYRLRESIPKEDSE